MRWPSIAKKDRAQPNQGSWQDWKQVIADYCEGRCIYCAISEARFGGVRNFHVEHFRPKKKFPRLENDIGNLYLACCICNVLKCDDWPANPRRNHSVAAYPDPCQCDYNDIFEVSETSFQIESTSVAGKYIIERLLLNRGQLTLQRRLSHVLGRVEAFQCWMGSHIDVMTQDERERTLTILSEVITVQRKIFDARPYTDPDTKRGFKPKVRKQRSR